MNRKKISSLSNMSKRSEDSSSPNDYLIIDKIRAGQTEQYQVLMRRYNQRLYRIARSILLDDHAAMDAVQNAHINAFKNLAKYRGDTGFPTWISTIARNEALMILRKIKSDKLIDLNQDDLPTVVPIHADSSKTMLKNPEDQLAITELRALLNSHIDGLPDSFREAFVMRCVEGFSVRETAEILGINSATIKTRVYRAKALLHARIAVEYGERTYEIGGRHCGRIVAKVMVAIERISEHPDVIN